MRDDFAAIILSHGRPDNVVTYETLRKAGYTGKIYILLDDMDTTRQEYINRYGDQVVVFDKEKIRQQSDLGNNFKDYRSTTYPRNAMWDVARDLGLKYFIQLDDDYTEFRYRFDHNHNYIGCALIKNLDRVFDIMLRYLAQSQITSLCLAQGGDYVAGPANDMSKAIKVKRKAMNSFICDVDRPFKCLGQLNEDVNAYISHGVVGKLFFTTSQISLQQKQTQSNAGGMTDIYKAQGTYVKSFYSVMFQPSSVKVTTFPTEVGRIHHAIRWNNTVPKIIREEYRRE